MTKAGLSPTRLRRKVLALCAEANYVGDLISELAHEARDQQQALLLAGRAHRISIEAVSPEIFGHVFSPVAYLMGVDQVDTGKVGSLLGIKLAANEHVAYLTDL